tara:strand:+ start:30667 stop:30816 length:150 start_codon:yes stop_codon:yes gene_type:complete
MALVDEQHEWGAAKVRQTFLDYFKKNGHTFGRTAPSTMQREKFMLCALF